MVIMNIYFESQFIFVNFAVKFFVNYYIHDFFIVCFLNKVTPCFL